MRSPWRSLVLVAVCSAPLSAQSVDSILGRYLKTIGGMDRIQAVQSLRRSGRFMGGGGFEAAVLEESRRPNLVRQEFSLQGMTGINAYDGHAGWKIEPWQGKKDPESLSEEELHDILIESDFDGPLVNYQQKGIKVEFAGMDQVDGSDTYKLKVSFANGDIRFYYLDTDTCVPIKIDDQRMIRGAVQEFETILGDYKQVAGWYLPFSFETRAKGSPGGSSITYQKIEANVAIDSSRFTKPQAH
jgi:hypothetical protein